MTHEECVGLNKPRGEGPVWVQFLSQGRCPRTHEWHVARQDVEIFVHSVAMISGEQLLGSTSIDNWESLVGSSARNATSSPATASPARSGGLANLINMARI